ncbi:ATP-binding protein [Sphingomonas sp. GCM10030256]|uniref:GAF domain-containing sensor histidine kinase n=1 Tax=Sphingomonas sp. GCM10030256 TaxID=3273427 RepID=UPI003618C27A
MLTTSADMEQRRQEAIAAYQLSSGGRDSEFDAVTELAAELFDMPIALVTVLSSERQLFRGSCGLDVDGTARDVAFCNRTVEQNDVFVVEDATQDDRFADNPLVTGPPHIRFYAGAPIVVDGGIAVGSLCLIDRKPRQLGERDATRLIMLARTVSDMIELRIGSRVAEERKQSLQRQSELLRATIDHVQQGIGVFDADLRLVLWNGLLIDLLRLPPELISEGRTAEELLLAAAREGAFGPGKPEAIVAPLLQSVRTTPSRRMDLNMPDGRILDAWRSAISDGRSILTIQDVTEQRRAARMKDEFVSTVSHELRTPLTAIRGSLAILARGAEERLDARGAQMLAMAGKNAERLTNLINDILDIEKLGSGVLTMSEDRLDLAQVLREVTEQNRPFAAAHGVELALDISDEPLAATGDAGRLHQALTNLVSNACKYSPDGGKVTIRGQREADQALLTVKDRGPGIPIDFRPHIFGRFAQAGPDHQQGRAGSGLGLTISKAIVERHRGDIGFDSEVGQGSCFWIRLPLAREEA